MLEEQENRGIEKLKLHKFKKKNREIENYINYKKLEKEEKQKNREIENYINSKRIEKQRNRKIEKQIESKNRYSLFLK